MYHSDEYTHWHGVDERFWSALLPSAVADPGVRMIRVWPGTPEYEQVVRLRYDGLVESGFLDGRRDKVEAMALDRDEDAIILGRFRDGELDVSVTRNTVTPRFPALAMELEKGVRINHPCFRHPEALEFSKLVASNPARRMRGSLHLLCVVVLLARALGKRHFWQVSRDLPGDIAWRERFGFDYGIDYRFDDPSLNGMPSRVGYMCLDEVLANRRVHPLVREIYRAALTCETALPAHRASSSPRPSAATTRQPRR